MKDRGVEIPPRPGAGRRGWRLVGLGLVALFVLGLLRFYTPGLGFTSLLSIGSRLDEVSGLRRVPHHVYPDSYGYDGAYYVQLALHPLLGNPELPEAIDNLHYRAKRILLSWTAWAAGLGRAEWIVHVFPLLNIAAWFALAGLLWRWVPPDSGGNLLRWAGILFSHGVCMSVRHSLADLPSLLGVAATVALWERQRANAARVGLAAALLTKETSVLAGLLFAAPPAGDRRWWLRLLTTGAVVVAPLAGWMIYLRLRLGAADAAGFNNFGLPLVGWFGKWREIAGGLAQDGWWSLHTPTLLTVIALSVQAAFLLARWRPAEVWWRAGIGFAVLFVFVAQPVWEGQPGAATRVLLPMTLAFNLLVPRGRRWLPVLLAGNLSVAASFAEFRPPVRDFLTVSAESAQLAVDRGEGWYQAESNSRDAWRWARQRAVLQVENRSGGPLRLRLAADLGGLRPQRLQVRVGEGAPVLDAALEVRARRFESDPFVVPPGVTELVFASDRSEEQQSNGDPRALSFSVGNLAIAVAPASTVPHP